MSLKILRAAIHRTGDVGIDLPAGVSAGSLEPWDYHPLDMEPEERAPAVIGVDLPAGASAKELRPEDYKPFVTEAADPWSLSSGSFETLRRSEERDGRSAERGRNGGAPPKKE